MHFFRASESQNEFALVQQEIVSSVMFTIHPFVARFNVEKYRFSLSSIHFANESLECAHCSYKLRKNIYYIYIIVCSDTGTGVLPGTGAHAQTEFIEVNGFGK